MHKKPLFVQMGSVMVVVGACVFSFTASAREVPLCEGPPTFAETRQYGSIEYSQLPKKVFVARSVDFWWDQKSGFSQLFASHSFQSMRTEIRCVQTSGLSAENWSGYVPALLDFSPQKTWGDSVWQIHAMTDTKRSGFWPQKTRLAPVGVAQELAKKGIWRQLDLNTFELLISEKRASQETHFRVLFDLMNP